MTIPITKAKTKANPQQSVNQPQLLAPCFLPFPAIPFVKLNERALEKDKVLKKTSENFDK